MAFFHKTSIDFSLDFGTQFPSLSRSPSSKQKITPIFFFSLYFWLKVYLTLSAGALILTERHYTFLAESHHKGFNLHVVIIMIRIVMIIITMILIVMIIMIVIIQPASDDGGELHSPRQGKDQPSTPSEDSTSENKTMS